MSSYFLRENESVCQCVAIGISDDGIHDESYECKVCKKCCADEPMLKESWESYGEKGTCVTCCLNNGTSLEEIAGVVNDN